MYVIASIKDRGFCITTQLLAGRLMRKCRTDEVPESVTALVEQCAEGIKFNWAEFLCEEYLMNCREAQD